MFTARSTGTRITLGAATALLLVAAPLTAHASQPAAVTAAATVTVTAAVRQGMLQASLDLPTGTRGEAYTAQVDPFGASVTFSATGLPEGLTIDAYTGVISGTPIVSGTFTAHVDQTGPGDAGVVHSDDFLILINDAPLPVVVSSPPGPATAGTAYTFQIDTDIPVTYEVTGLPDGLDIDTSTGVISGIPLETGSFEVTVTMTTEAGAVSTYVFTLAVDQAPLPVVTSGEPPMGTNGDEYAFQIVTDIPATFEGSGFPAGVTIDDTGLISGTPQESGTFEVTITLTTGAGATVDHVITLVISPSDQAPVFENVVDELPGTVGTQFSYTPDVTSSTPVTYTINDDVPGLTFDPTTGTLSGTPTEPGVYTVTITATDRTDTSTSMTFTLTVSPAVPVAPPSPGTTGESALPTVIVPAGTGGSVSTGSSPTGTSGRGGTLANTGASPLDVLAAAAAVLLLFGGASILIARRRPAR